MKSFNDEVYGKIKFKEDFYQLTDTITIKIGENINNVVCQIEIYNLPKEKFKLELYNSEIMDYYRENINLLEDKDFEGVELLQRNLFEKYIKNNAISIIIEEAALRRRKEILEGETEESFAKIVGKEKSQRCFAAKTREEKLSSIKLQKMRIFKDCIEITCICDWFNPSGGFTIFEDGSAEMLYVDSMSI